MQPYAKKSRRTSSEAAVSALAPEQGTLRGFPLSDTLYHFFSRVECGALCPRVTCALCGDATRARGARAQEMPPSRRPSTDARTHTARVLCRTRDTRTKLRRSRAVHTCARERKAIALAVRSHVVRRVKRGGISETPKLCEPQSGVGSRLRTVLNPGRDVPVGSS